MKQERKQEKKQEKKGGMNRRDFLATAATGIAGFMILPSFTIDGVRIAPSDRVVLGFVGVGQQGCSDFWSFTGCPGVQVAACCDVDSIKRERFRRLATKWQKEKGMPQRCDMYEEYERLLERKDIDAIEIATPDHWHALVAIHSLEAGKDVYLQKPWHIPSPRVWLFRLQSDTTIASCRWDLSNAAAQSSNRLLHWYAQEDWAISRRFTAAWAILQHPSTFRKCPFPRT